MSEGVGGAGGAGAGTGASSVGGAQEAGRSSSVSSNASASAEVDGAMGDVTSAEMSAAADSITETKDTYDKAEEEAGLCIGTRDECQRQERERAQKEADAMTDEQAIKALDGAFLHDPTSLTPAQVKGLEALSRQPHLHPSTREKIDAFLQDHYNDVDRLGIYGQLGRFDRPSR